MIAVDPALTPVRVGVIAPAVVIPCGTRMVDGDTAATPGALLASVTDTPPAGAGVPNDTGRFTV